MMMKKMLEINDLYASVGENAILKGLNLSINPGECHVIMGPNGAGKSTLANTIMGHPNYQVDSGEIFFESEEITNAKTDERARKGMFLSFQNPEEVEGITVENFLRSAKTAVTGEEIKAFAFHKQLGEIMNKLNFDHSYASRYLNVGFSGGEKKKNEIFQMLTLDPKLAILDETDSGLDVDAVKIVSEGIQNYKNPNNAIIIITHNAKLLENIEADYVHIIIDGKIVKTGDKSLINEINESGFSNIVVAELGDCETH